MSQIDERDFTYLKVTGWGWFYLSTVLDDFSRSIVAWKLCTTMKAEDVTSTLELFHPGGSLETNSRQEAEPPPISASSMDVQNH